MSFINFEKLENELQGIREDFYSKKPFRYTVIENLFHNDKAEAIYNSYPAIENGTWNGTTYIDQKNKFQMTKFEDGSLLQQVFDELNGQRFLGCLEKITGIDELVEDDDLFGGGLHQSIKGAFLNVHVDYNMHPETKYHRRLNAIVFMNKDWKEEWEGHLELWDLTDDKMKQIEKISPIFNRCVIFETNEISFHGHPRKLNTPNHVNRKSLATYYYTKTRPEHEIAPEHNTIYVNTEGAGGQLKRFTSGVKALLERINMR